jgi:lipopolysaccharide export LptBFGC system permease protein LptF
MTESPNSKAAYRRITIPLLFVIMAVYIFGVSSQHAYKEASIILKVIAIIGIIFFGRAVLKGWKSLKSNHINQ